MVVAGGGGNGELVFSGCRVSVGGAEEVPEMDGGGACTAGWMSSVPLSCAEWLKRSF